MNDLLTIWLKSNIVFTILVLFFALVLRRETLHYFKRLYLLSIPVIAIAFPFLRFSTSDVQLVQMIENIRFLPSVNQTSTTMGNTISEHSFDWNTMAYWIFGLVSMTLVVMTIRGFFQVWSIITHAEKEDLSVGTLCDTRRQVNPFSFFNYIVLDKQSHTESDLQKIIQHEQVHVYQRHFVDMLLAQLSIILGWFNPAVWMYRHYVTENLEFIVDQEVLQTGVNKKQYQFSILSTSVYDSSLVFANHFNHSLIKNRIKMMNKKLSNPRNMWKATLAIPLLFIAILVTGQVNYSVDDTRNHRFSDGENGVEITTDTIDFDNNKFTFKGNIKLNSKNVRSRTTEPLYIINGKIVDKNTVQKLEQNTIKNISVLKNDKAIQKYGQKGENGVVEITADTVVDNNIKFTFNGNVRLNSKNVNPRTTDPLYVIDGKIADKNTVEKLDQKAIKNISVLKDNKAIQKYGEKGKNGVVEITLKSTKK